MKDDSCPRCGSEHFYVKNPDDEFDIVEFTYQNGEIRFDPEVAADDALDIDEHTEIYCNKCAWHAKAGASK